MAFSDKELDLFLDDDTGSIKLTTDADIDAFLDDKLETLPQPRLIQQVATQAVKTALPSPDFSKPIAPTSSNPGMAGLQAAMQTLRDPTRIQATMSQPGQLAGQKVEEKTGSKLAGFATEVLLDPMNLAIGGIVAKGAAKVGSKVAGVVGERVLAPAGEILSGVRVKDIARLFNHPKEVLTASLKKSGEVMGKLEREVFKITDDEARLISKAADRSTGGSRTVVEDLIKTGKERAVAAGRDSKNWADELTPGELIAGRRGASKLTFKGKGREEFIAVKDLKSFEQSFVNKAKDHALQYLAAVRENSMARTKDAFLRVFPQNQNTSANALRGSGMFAEAMFINPLVALAHTPAATGLATLAAKLGYQSGKKVGTSAARIAGMTSLPALRALLQKQPGS